MGLQLRRRAFTVAEYYRMAEAGVLTEDDRVELLDGEIVDMTPIGSRHAACVRRLDQLFSRELAGRALVSVQSPIRLGERSEPQPDVVLLRPRADFYAGAHPGPSDILLVVEVADASLEFDRTIKLPLYARAGIPEVWLVGLVEDIVEVHRQPTPAGYQATQRLGRGARVVPEAFPGVALAVADVVG